MVRGLTSVWAASASALVGPRRTRNICMMSRRRVVLDMPLRQLRNQPPHEGDTFLVLGDLAIFVGLMRLFDRSGTAQHRRHEPLLKLPRFARKGHGDRPVRAREPQGQRFRGAAGLRREGWNLDLNFR